MCIRDRNKDLTEALETLEDAIRKIDKETRERFKETFDKVNTPVSYTHLTLPTSDLV